MTDYIILVSVPQSGGADEVKAEHWEQYDRTNARSPEAAIRHALNGAEKIGRFVAVPARSWKPVTVKVETKTALKFS